MSHHVALKRKHRSGSGFDQHDLPALEICRFHTVSEDQRNCLKAHHFCRSD